MVAVILVMMAAIPAEGAAATLLEDNFENGLGRWHISGANGVRIVDSGDAAHGKVMLLSPNGDVLALIKDSERFGAVRLDGDVMFVDDHDSYLGVAYHHRRRGPREDFGLIYIKGNDSYLQANPHRDWNVSRTVYPEYRAALEGQSAIRTKQWQHFAVEVVGREVQFYVGDAKVPQMAFPLFEGDAGAIGLQPRSVGGDVWVDNIRVRAIDRFSAMAPTPAPAVDRSPLLTAWSVSGPYDKTDDDLARQPSRHASRWRPMPTDARGAVITGSVADYHGRNTVAYFHTRVERARTGDAELRISTVDDLALWVNGRFWWFIPRADLAWFDFLKNPAHKPQRIPLDLEQGVNDLVFRVRGGVYASGGFFAAVTERGQN